jgi:hypothetical protein
MPMIDVYAPAGAFEDKHGLARCLAGGLMTIEEVPDIAMFRGNTATFIHELPPTWSPRHGVSWLRPCRPRRPGDGMTSE